ncbi:DNA-processing protein DprA [Paracoccus solventivorans]|uniref:DNA-processing protein DprA n=1 Tax=Paracoccus solventivorans TaxID=53463 RepID=UPI002D1FC0E1|nr:DNA-processing protein DprA [Paracoccus solventivorans]
MLRLIRSRRVGPATFHRLIAEHGSAAAALDALPGIAAAAGIRGYEPCPPGVARAELAAGARAGARLLRTRGPHYPPLLATISDAPPVLWLRGRVEALHRPAGAVVGARNASSLGLRMARHLAAGLAEAGLVVAAGLARGIDTAAHQASCAQGTIAVMAGGIDVIYPAENRALADRICDLGCLLTEQPPGVEPVARHFPARNRIVSGISAAVVVIEAACRSGSLITARLAGEQGREVMAVPGHPLDARASGCNALIRDGATLVRNAEDVLALIRPLSLPGLDGFRADSGIESTVPVRASRTAASRSVAAAAGEEPAVAGNRQPSARRGDATKPHRGGQYDAPAAVQNAQAVPSGYGPEAIAPAGSGQRSSAPDPHPHARPSASPLSSPTFGASPDSTSPPAELRSRLLQLLGPSPTDEDSLIRDLGIAPARLAPTLLDLELDGTITRLPGGRIALA